MLLKGVRWVRFFIAGRRVPPPPYSLVEVAVPAARARAFTEAALVLLAGFVLDDLRALRVPGFMVGIAGALLLLAFGSAFYARRMAARADAASLQNAEARLRTQAAFWRLAAVAAVALFLVWLGATSGGRNLWAA